jgi:hypothetical protein
MGAEELRGAAARLRALAEAATPGPWAHAYSDMCRNQIESESDDMDMPIASTWAADGIPDNDYQREESNAALIAALGPTFALAVADLLDVWLEHDLLDSSGSLADERQAISAIAAALWSA